MFYLLRDLDHPHHHSFPTRRSSDLAHPGDDGPDRPGAGHVSARRHQRGRDRKSTRLNSSHANTSYAVFCLKKKTLPGTNPVSEVWMSTTFELPGFIHARLMLVTLFL